MLLQLEKDFEALVICHSTVKAIIDQRIGNVNPSSEDLVQVSTQLVGDSALVNSVLKLQDIQLSVDVVDVIVEVTTHDNRSAGVLSNDVPDDINDPHCPFFEVLLVPWLEVTVENLDIYVAQL